MIMSEDDGDAHAKSLARLFGRGKWTVTPTKFDIQLRLYLSHFSANEERIIGNAQTHIQITAMERTRTWRLERPVHFFYHLLC